MIFKSVYVYFFNIYRMYFFMYWEVELILQ